jgi:hypothetical protein
VNRSQTNRDHLEERLEELARAGVPREKAVVQALDEFGDAAVLAGDFATIACLKRRRFLMRLSLGSVGALAAGLLIAFAFWPDNRAVRGPERIVAQEKPKAERPKEEVRPSRGGTGSSVRNTGSNHSRSHQPPVVLEPSVVEHPLSSDVVECSKAEARIAEALNAPVDFAIEPQPLKDALDFIAARYQIPILINQKAFEDANLDSHTEVGLNIPGISLHDAFHWIFSQMNAPVGYEIRNGALLISTCDNINDDLQTIVYDCRDLVTLPTLDVPVMADHSPAESGQGVFQVAGSIGPASTTAKKSRSEQSNDHAARRLPLIQTILSTSLPGAWPEGASISELAGLLVVRQNPFEQDRIKRLLASIRLMKKDGAFAALSDQYEVEAKKRPADERALTTRLLQLERELEAFRKERAAPAKPETSAAAAK